VVTQVPSELTSVEKSLVEHVLRGELLDLADGDEAVDEPAMRSWGISRTCRASVIRDILRGRLAVHADPHGLRLRGARITGRLDLENIATAVNLELRDCLLEEGVIARGARLAFFGLVACRLEHSAEPPLTADRLTCSVLTLSGARITGHTSASAVRLTGAHISDSLDCNGATLRNESGPALFADGLQVSQDMLLREGFTATGAGKDGAIRLTGAHVGGRLLCDGASLRNDSGPALVAYGLQVGQGVFLRRGFTATGAGERGAVRLVGAHIGGQFDCDGAKLRNDSGPALYADRLQVDQSMLLRDGFTATGSGGDGAIWLSGARIGGHLYCDGAELRNYSGPALDAYSLQVGQGMHLFGGFTATASSGFCAVNLTGAHIGARLLCDGASLRNDSGPALVAYGGLQVGQGVFLRRGFTATGAGERAAIALTGARIGGSLDCTGAALRNDSGPALIAGGLQAGQDIYLAGGFTATGGGADVTIDLTGAQVGGTLAFDPVRLEHAADPHRRLAVDGLTYAGVPQPISAQDWLRLLRDGTPGYAAQPYQQLAAGYRALGNERQAREILMAQRDDELARADTRWPERLWGKITKVTLGYGYQPWRALLFLAAVVAVSCVLAVVLGAHGALAQTSNTVPPGRSCTVVQQVSVGLDLNLPVGTSAARADCDLTTDSASAAAAWLTAAGWVLRLLAWVFAALFIAGFTSAVRKT
jgi:hypothetical protein